MTIPAHDSVAYLPARPRLALLRKEADQLKLCLPYPTLRPKDQCDLCFGGGAAARFLPAGGSGRAIPVSRSNTGCGLHSTLARPSRQPAIGCAWSFKGKLS